MRYFLLEYIDNESDSRISRIHAIEGNAEKFIEKAEEKCEKVVELEEKQVVLS